MPEIADSNLEIVRDAVEAINREGLEGALRMIDQSCHPEVEWRPLLGGIETRVYRGLDGLREYWRDMFEAFEEIQYKDADLRLVGEDIVVALATIVLRGRGSGAPVEMEIGTVFQLDQGLFTKGTVFRSHAEALAAA